MCFVYPVQTAGIYLFSGSIRACQAFARYHGGEPLVGIYWNGESYFEFPLGEPN